MVAAVRGSDGPVTVWKQAGLIDNLDEIPDEDGRGPECVIRGYPGTTALSSLTPGIGGIDSVIAVTGVHKVKPCSEGTYSSSNDH